MKKTLLTILQYLIFLGLGIWIVYHMLHQLSPKQETELIDAIESINPWYLIPISIAGFFSHFFRALRWRYLLDTAGMRPSVLNTSMAVMIGYITNLALPRAGEVAKCTVLAKYEKMPAHKMIGTIVAERAFDIVCLIIIAIGTFLLQFNQIDEYVGGRVQRLGDKIILHRQTLIICVLVLVAFIMASVFIYKRSRETKFGRFMKEMNHGIMSIMHMKKRGQFLIYTVLIWLMYVMQIYIGLKSLPATHHLSPLSAMVVLVYGSVGMIITPGGIGLYPFLVAQILGVYMISDVPAQAFGWIAWSVQTAIIIILGVISLLFIHPYNRRKNAEIALDTAQNI
jgi:uncharacterized protein (TIRG00374 family)